jgi:hypothetical protein
LAITGQTTVQPPVQPPAPVSSAAADALQSALIPTYVLFGFSYNQFAAPPIAGLFSAIEPESQGIGLLASESVDLLPVKYTDPVTKRTGYLFTGSVRFGQHKMLINTDKSKPGDPFKPSFALTLGGDLGAAFSSTGSTASTAGSTSQPSAISIGFSGSFTVGAFYRFKQHWAAGLAVRALYLPGIGPGGQGAMNGVIEPALVYCK